MNLNIFKDDSELIYYNHPELPVYVRKGDLKSFPNMEALCHWHEDIEFLLAVKGHISYKVNGTVFTLEEGDAIFVNSRQMHYGFSSDQTDCEYICIVINPRTLFSLSSVLLKYVEPILESGRSELIIHPDHDAHRQLTDGLRLLYALYIQDAALLELNTMQCLYKIWAALYQIMQPYLKQQIKEHDSNLPILKNMLSDIYQHYDAKITLSDIACAGGIGKSKCCRIFKQYLNRSPNDYLNSYRIEKSMDLLRNPSMNITEIAYACGFGNPSYFSETFLKYKGCTPTEYRVELKGNEKSRKI